MRLVGFDIETWGEDPAYAFQPYRVRKGAAWITCCAWVMPTLDGTSTVSQVYPHVDDLRKVLRFCSQRRLRIVGWNMAFDVAWLIALGLREEVYACQWLDAMLLLKHLTVAPTFEGKPRSYGLKPAVEEFLPIFSGYADDVDFGAERDTPEFDKLARYNERDTLYARMLALQFWGRMTLPQQRAALIEAACIPMVAETHVQGIKINEPALTRLDAALETKITAARSSLFQADPTLSDQIIASPTQLAEHISQSWGLAPQKLTPKGSTSVDREALSMYAVLDPRATQLNEFREASANRAKFVESTRESLDYNEDGFVRPSMRVFGTYSGRATYSSKQGKGVNEVPSGVALHQWRRDKDFRALIEPPEGYDLLEFDFAGQEFRWMAVASGDHTMLHLCRPGEDAHSYMGAQIANLDYKNFMVELKQGVAGRKETRQLGKFANLSAQYRSGANTMQRIAAIQHKLNLPLHEVEHIIKTYRQTYPLVPVYWRNQIWKAKRHNYIENMVGRRVHFKPMAERKREDDWGYSSTAINYPIQSMGADQKYLALMVLLDLLPQWGGKFYYDLHDGLFVIVPNSKSADALPVIGHALSNLPYKRAFGVDLPIAFPVDCKIGPNWGALTEVKI